MNENVPTATFVKPGKSIRVKLTTAKWRKWIVKCMDNNRVYKMRLQFLPHLCHQSAQWGVWKNEIMCKEKSTMSGIINGVKADHIIMQVDVDVQGITKRTSFFIIVRVHRKILQCVNRNCYCPKT